MTDSNPDQWQAEHDGRLEAMVTIAEEAGRSTLRYFGDSDLTVEAKEDASPVTVADREAEQLVRSLVSDRFAFDTLEGEEFAAQRGTSPYRWIVDPIDGTKSFVCGVPLYSTLLALEFEEKPLGGVIFIPALGEMIVAAIGHGCWHRRNAAIPWTRAQVSKKAEFAGSVFLTSQVDSFRKRGAFAAYEKLEHDAWLTRTWGDGYGYLMVATGRADFMVDPICSAWDIAAIQPIITEAGGRFTDWKGVETTRSGEGIGSNGLVHNEVLRRLQG